MIVLFLPVFALAEVALMGMVPSCCPGTELLFLCTLTETAAGKGFGIFVLFASAGLVLIEAVAIDDLGWAWFRLTWGDSGSSRALSSKTGKIDSSDRFLFLESNCSAASGDPTWNRYCPVESSAPS